MKRKLIFFVLLAVLSAGLFYFFTEPASAGELYTPRVKFTASSGVARVQMSPKLATVDQVCFTISFDPANPFDGNDMVTIQMLPTGPSIGFASQPGEVVTARTVCASSLYTPEITSLFAGSGNQSVDMRVSPTGAATIIGVSVTITGSRN